MKPVCTRILKFLILCSLLQAASAAAADLNYEVRLIEKGTAFFVKGNFSEAAIAFQRCIEYLEEKDSNSPYRLDAAMKLSECYKICGHYNKALAVLEKTSSLLKKSDDRYRNALFFNSLADIHLCLGNTEKMTEYIMEAVRQARLSGDSRILASVLNDLGNCFTANQDYQNALHSYQESMDTIISDKDESMLELRIKTLINMARALYFKKDIKEAVSKIRVALWRAGGLAYSYGRAAILISINRLAIDIYEEILFSSQDDAREIFRMGYIALTKAEDAALKIDNARMLSYVYGYMGQMYEKDIRYNEAEKLTRKAIFYCRQGDYKETLYLWFWQMGRIYAAMGYYDKAAELYTKSIEVLNPIRVEFFGGLRLNKNLFETHVKPVYLGLAELLLNQADNASAKPARQVKIREAMDAMELLKSAELQDFFKDECLAEIDDSFHSRAYDRTPDHTVLLYPVIFPKKLVIIASFPGSINKLAINIDSNYLIKIVKQFRTGLQNRTSGDFIIYSQKLYEWLIAPFEELFNYYDIKTVVVSPDGVLRLIPFSALYDGSNFLVEKYAVSVIPALNLTEKTDHFDYGKADILISGLSEGVQGFSPLPSVASELRDIKNIMSGKVLYENRGHNFENLMNEFKHRDYPIVHLAAHGVFGGKPENTFLLLYKDKLNMNRLSRLINAARMHGGRVELLTLSACQTAMGDEKAALGLAGTAVRAGVKSVVATLWFVDDEAASLTIKEFYRKLKLPETTKAQALQQAQKSLLNNKRFRHPAYWAPFLLIGSWN